MAKNLLLLTGFFKKIRNQNSKKFSAALFFNIWIYEINVKQIAIWNFEIETWNFWKLKWKIGICLEFMTCSKIFSTKLRENQYKLYKILVQAILKIWLTAAICTYFWIFLSTRRGVHTKTNGTERKRKRTERNAAQPLCCCPACLCRVCRLVLFFWGNKKTSPKLKKLSTKLPKIP